MKRVSGGVALGIALAIALVADLGLDHVVADSSVRQLLMLVACNMVVALSLNVINGMAGQFSIGHAGFLALGAYTSAIVSSHVHLLFGGGEPTFARSFVVVPVALVSGAIVAGAFGFLVGLPSLRLRGDYLAIVTLGFAETVRLVIATSQANAKGGFLGFVAKLGGQTGYAGPGGDGVPLYAGPFWIFGITAISALIAWRLKFSGWGRKLRALREDEIAAASVGVDPTRTKVTAFVLSAAGGGIAGGMLAIMRDGTPIVQPDTFGFQATFDAVTMVILGGSGSVTGVMIGSVVVTLSVKAIELLQATDVVQAFKADYESLDLNALRTMIYAAILI
ncbi:MAG TPA: branched-chain amino acid ABC transporter permease, partial [Polyangiaceae bacterium]